MVDVVAVVVEVFLLLVELVDVLDDDDDYGDNADAFCPHMKLRPLRLAGPRMIVECIVGNSVAMIYIHGKVSK